jgi:restriction endonuclease Mrr
LDLRHSTAAESEDERNEFDPSKMRETSLSSTERGEKPSTKTAENKTETAELRIKTAESDESPTTVTAARSVKLASVPLHSATEFAKTSKAPLLKSQLTAVISSFVAL